MTIRTKWHRVAEAISAGRSAVYTGSSQIGGRLEEWGTTTQDMLSWWNETLAVPKFVVEHELVSMASENRDFHLSLRDMQRANVLRLPFPIILVEYNVRPSDYATNFVILVDLHDEVNRVAFSKKNSRLVEFVDGKGMSFLAYPYILGHANSGHQEVVGVPSSVCLTGILSDSNEPLLSSMRYPNPMLHAPDAAFARAMEVTKSEVQSWSALAFMTVTLLMMTEGVEKEQCSVGNLNKKRVASGKAPIPDVTYLRIGRVYRSAQGNDSVRYESRKSPRPHWRRGHLRSVRYGTGREKLRHVFIRPRLVALKSDATVPSTPTYVMT